MLTVKSYPQESERNKDINFYFQANAVDIVPSYIHMEILSSIITHITDLLFPRTCSGCRKAGTFLCDVCLTRAPKAEPISNHTSSFVTAIFDYRNDAIRTAIWRFKYRNARDIAKCFGGLLYDQIIGEVSDDLQIKANDIFFLVPIPLHKYRLHERGYNQSNLLAREIIRYAKEQGNESMFTFAPEILLRTRKTRAQAKSQKRSARFENLRGAFTAITTQTQNRHIILIDDVTTTGATLTEARKALLKSGAKTVRAYTIAH